MAALFFLSSTRARTPWAKSDGETLLAEAPFSKGLDFSKGSDPSTKLEVLEITVGTARSFALVGELRPKMFCNTAAVSEFGFETKLDLFRLAVPCLVSIPHLGSRSIFPA
ncbi:MAG: hypothetical protein IPM50_02950 [Acidobacteriota bacterium]|nr:MAG: hypothetical protein IPM50_02950 [Acidobacteriota bacterium]